MDTSSAESLRHALLADGVLGAEAVEALWQRHQAEGPHVPFGEWLVAGGHLDAHWFRTFSQRASDQSTRTSAGAPRSLQRDGSVDPVEIDPEVLARDLVLRGVFDADTARGMLREYQAARDGGGEPRDFSSWLVARGGASGQQVELARLDLLARTAGETVAESEAARPGNAPDLDTQPGLAAPGGVQRGKRFGRYDLIDEVGRGGMGVIYRAFDPQLRRTVALKVMLARETTPEERSRFQREASLAARVRHPNLVQIYDVGEIDGTLYYTMELVEGESVQSVLRRAGRLPPRVALRIAGDAARGLHAAHEQNLIHRDIKPANIMLLGQRAAESDANESVIDIRGTRATQFRVLVTDFGIAKDVAGQTQITRTGAVVGTPAYMSPEQVDRPEEISGRSDLYSLGVCLYFMLCGELPFRECDPLKMLAAVLTTDPPPLRSRAADLHPDLETLTAKAMMKEPHRRYASAADFADDIDRYLAGEMIRARPATAFERLYRRVRRHWEMAAAVLVAVAAILGAVFVTVALPQIDADRLAQREAADRAAREQAAARQLAGAEAELAAGRPEPAITRAEALLSAFASAARAGEAVRVPEAHDLIARAQLARHEPKLALLARFRARRAAMGSAASQDYALRVLRECVLQLRFDEAVLTGARLLREIDDPALAAQARYWLGRASEGRLDFATAVGWFMSVLTPGTLPADLHQDAERQLAFCRSLAGPADPQSTSAPRIDLEGDGTPEFAEIRDGRLCVVSGTGADRRVVATADLPPGLAWEPHAWLIPLAAPPVSGVACAFADVCSVLLPVRGQGRTACAGPSATLPVKCFMPGLSADLDGDRRQELVALGFVPGYQASVCAYRVDPATAAISSCGELPVGDCYWVNLQPCDFDRDGAQELALFQGEWGGFGARIFRWDRDRSRLAQIRLEPLALPTSVWRIDGASGPEFIFGCRWLVEYSYPLLRQYGREEFQRRYLPAGAYRLTPRPDFTFDRQSLTPGDWSDGGSGDAHVFRVQDTQNDLLFVERRAYGPLAGEPGAATARTTFVYDVARGLELLVTLVPPEGTRLFESRIRASDGRAEVLVHSPDGQYWIGPATDKSATGALLSAPDASVALHIPPLLQFGREAQEVGLYEEALSAFRETTRKEQNLLDVERAIDGQFACLAASGRYAELAETALQLADRLPDTELYALRTAFTTLEDALAWSEAARVVGRLRRCLQLAPSGQVESARQERDARAQAEMVHRIELIGPQSGTIGWLASSPFVGNRAADGTWTLQFPSGRSSDWLVAPIRAAGLATRVEVKLHLLRHEWASGFSVGLGSLDARTGWGPANYGLRWFARGETAFPLRLLLGCVGGPQPTVVERVEDWPGSLHAVLTHYSERRRLAGVMRQDANTAYPFDWPAREPIQAVLGVGIRNAGSSEGGRATIVRVEQLTVLGNDDRLALLPPTLRSGRDHFVAANGSWLVGDLARARTAYDVAVQLLELDRDKEARARQAGLPAEPDPAAALLVDALVSRGLLRAVTGDPTGGRTDLTAAWRLDRERFVSMVREGALTLLDRPVERAALGDFHLEQLGRPAREQLLNLAVELAASHSFETAQVLVPGLIRTVHRQPVLSGLSEGSPAWQLGLRAGQVVTAVNGQATPDLDAVNRALEAAKSAGAPRAVLGVSGSEGEETRVELGLGVLLGLRFRARETTTYDLQ